MRIKGVQWPRLWWFPFAGMGALIVSGGVAIAIYFSGALLTPAERARLNVERGDVTMEQLNEAITLNPDYDEAYIKRAKLRLKENNLPGAESDLDKALEHRQNDVKLLQLRAEIHKADAAGEK
jgi:tetratricopeptide (TPR) repeat protein